MRHFLSKLLATTLVLALLAPAGVAQAEPSLMVSPTRVVFDGSQRTVVLTLLNNGSDSGTYRLSLVHFRMAKNGAFENVTKPSAEELAADRLIRYTPRQIVLPPKQAQVVRVQLRIPRGLATGEYRTHLLFRVLPTVQQAASSDEQAKGISIRLVPAVGVSIPLIVRHGATSAQASVSGLALVPQESGNARLALRLGRTGNASLYGNVVATFRPRHGAAREVGRANGVAVYTPNTERHSVLALNQPASALKGGTLEVTYEEPGAAGKELARAVLQLP